MRGAPGPGGGAGEEGDGGARAHWEPAPRCAAPVGAGRAAAALHGPLPRRPARRVNSGRGHGAVTDSRSVLRGCVVLLCGRDKGLYDTSLASSSQWNLVSDKQMIQEEQLLQFHQRREEPQGTQAWRNRYSEMNTCNC